MIGASTISFLAFEGATRLAAGDLADAAAAAWKAHQRAGSGPILVFSCSSGEVVDLDLRGSQADVLARYNELPATPKRGRPRLGVVAREVTLLPRHWDWLNAQPASASTTLRQLVEAASKTDAGLVRERRDCAYRFMAVLAGNLPGFEEAARALFAGDFDRLDVLTRFWPRDITGELFRWLRD